MREYYIFIRKEKIKKTKILTFGVDMEQSHSSFVGMQNDTDTLENSLAVSYVTYTYHITQQFSS